MLIADGHASTKHKDDLTYHMTAHLRMNAVYWGLTALCIMKRKEALDAEEMIEYVMSCWDDNAGASPMSPPAIQPPPSQRIANTSLASLPPLPHKGAFGAHPGHDAHILSTLSAIQILATHDALSRIDSPRIIDCTSPFPLPFHPFFITRPTSHSGPATTLGRLRRRRLWRDGHALPLLRRLGALPPRRARPTRSRADGVLPRLVPQL